MHYEKFHDGTVKCIEDEIPFEIPEGWVWTRLGMIGNWQAGATPSKGNTKYYKGNIPWLKTGDLNDNYITKIPEHISELALKETSVKLNPTGSILIAMYGATIGKLGILTFPATTNQACCACQPSDAIIAKYLFSFLLSHRQTFIQRGTGGAQPNISKEKIVSTLIALPPLEEQKRIAKAIIDLLKITGNIESKKQCLHNSLENTKSKILDLAIRGKLVPQDPNEEPASVLLERIQAEKEELIKQGKIKRDKNDSIIFKGDDNSYYEKMGNEVTCIDDEINFEIPKSWMWVRLGTLFMHNTGKALNSSNTEGIELPYITTSNVYWDGFELSNLKSMCFSESEIEKCTVAKGDLLICEGGDIGRSAIWNFDEPIRIQNHIHRLRAYIPLQTELYYYFMYLYKRNRMITGNGIGLQGLSSKRLHSIIVPLPPINEQKNITTKIKVLFKNLQTMEQSFI